MANLDNIQLDGLGTFNQSTINSGVIKYGEFNNASQNTGVVALSAVFKNSASNSGTIGNVLPVIAATLLASNSAHWNATYNAVVSNSATWMSGDSTSSFLQGISGHWEDTYNAFVANSAAWMNGSNIASNPELSSIISFVQSNSSSFVYSSDSRLTDDRNPLAHTQAISTVTGLQTALDNKANSSDLSSYVLGSDSRLSDSRNPLAHTQAISTVTGLQTALDGKLNTGATFSSSSITDFNSAVTSKISAAAGVYVASLVDGLVPAAQLPSYVDDVLEYSALASFPATGETGKIYVDATVKKIYRWSGSTYIEISPSPGSTDSVTEGSTNLYFTNSRASAAAPVQSVFGRTGSVVLSSSDVTSALGFTPATSSSVTTLQNTISTKADSSSLSSYVLTSDSRLSDARTPLAHTQAISTVTGLQTALDGKLNTGATFSSSAITDFSSSVSSQISAAAGSYVASLVNGLVPSTQLPSYVDDVLEYANLASFPLSASAETGKIYVDIATKKIYRWSGSAYVEISPSPGSTDAVPEGSTNLYYTNARASAAAPVQSVAGKTGVVTLGTSDISGFTSAASSAAPVQSVAGKTGTVTLSSSDIQGLSAAVVAYSPSISVPVQSVFGRTGAVVLSSSDVTGALGFTPVNTTDSRLTDARTPLAHTQAISTVTGLQTALDGKLSTGATFTSSSITDFSSAASSAAPVQSVAGKTGVVTLSSSDIQGLSAAVVAYTPASNSPIQSVFGRTGAVVLSSSDVSTALGYVPATNSVAKGSINFIMDGSGSAIAPGSKGYVQVPNNFIVQQWSITSDVTSTVSLDVKKATYSGLPTTASIVASDAPSITSGTKNSNTNVTTWTNISANDYLEFYLNTNSGAKLISITLVGTRS